MVFLILSVSFSLRSSGAFQTIWLYFLVSNVEPLFPDGGFPVLQVGVAYGAVKVDYRFLNPFKGLEIEGALVDGVEGKSTGTYASCPVDEYANEKERIHGSVKYGTEPVANRHGRKKG